jgi:hypothetical protein
MTNESNRACGVGFSALAAILLANSQTFAGPVRPGFVATCDNGHHYPVRARAVSAAGDLVTGELLIGHRGAASIRLIPMGFGYRYAAHGLWLDGWHGNAELHFGKHHPIACAVTPG